MKNKLNKIIVLAFAATLLFAVSASADSIEGYFGYMPGQTNLGDWLHITATGVNSGVEFTIHANLNQQAKFDTGEIFLYYTQNIFNGVLESGWSWNTGGGMNGGGNGWWAKAEYTALSSNDLFTWPGNDVVFTLTYSAGNDWDSFYSAAIENDPAFAMGIHMQRTPDGKSNKMLIVTWDDSEFKSGCDPDSMLSDPDCPSEVPEPGSILLLGTGIVGLSLVARRKLGKK